MKTTSFPKSWPCLTSNDLTISKEFIDELIVEMFTFFKPKGLDFGLELSYIILWAFDNCKSIGTFSNLVAVLFGRAIRRGVAEERRQTQKNLELFDVHMDTMTANLEEEIINRITIESLTHGCYTTEEVVDLDRRIRHKVVGKMKRRIKERTLT